MAFLGIKINNDIGRLLQGIDVPGNRETPSEYHITLLCFEDNWSISNISKALEVTYELVSNTSPFMIETNTITSFPKIKDKPIPIIAKIEGEEIFNLREKLAKEYDKNKIEFSKTFKEFKPHITLAYDDSNDKFEDLKIDPLKFSVNEIILWGGDNGDDRLFITFPLKGPKVSKANFLLQKSVLFRKLSLS